MISLKFKKSRRIGENIWRHSQITSKQRSILYKLKQNQTNKTRASDFAVALQNRTKLALIYGIQSNTLIKYRKISTNLNKVQSILLFLETRLDIILVRANLCSNISMARQFITHSKVCVNFKIVSIPSLHIQIGDIISLSNWNDWTNQKPKVQLLQGNPKPSHLEINYKLLSIVLLKEPCQIRFPYQIELDVL